jgi:DNA-binding XRE family transcriptional regulator
MNMSPLLRLRYDARLSRAQLSERADVSRETVGLVERGKVTPRPETAGKLVEVLSEALGREVRPSELLNVG